MSHLSFSSFMLAILFSEPRRVFRRQICLGYTATSDLSRAA